MISLADVYHVLEAIVPLYVAMILAYMSIKWCKLFTHEQCSGINKFVAEFSVPLLSFHVISTNNPYQMNLKLLFSDVIQKSSALLLFAFFSLLSSRGNLDWLITGFSLSTLPNTLIMGIPLLKAMYGDEATRLLGQIVVLQSLIWYTILLVLFEFRAARAMAAAPAESNELGEAEAPGVIQIKPAGGEARTSYPEENKTRFILLIVGRKLVENPNTYSSLAGFIWALVSFRWEKELPPIVNNSISILSDGGLGMAMFSLGLFTASQSRIIACGTWIAVLSMGIRFIVGPGLMAISSYATGMRGRLLSVAIVQAALPQGIVPFVLAKEYNVHPDILSTGVIVGMLIEIPIALLYYFLLDPK